MPTCPSPANDIRRPRRDALRRRPGGSAHVESVTLPAHAAAIVAQDDPENDRAGLCGRAPTVVAGDVRVAAGATGSVPVEGASRGKPAYRHPLPLNNPPTPRRAE